MAEFGLQTAEYLGQWKRDFATGSEMGPNKREGQAYLDP